MDLHQHFSTFPPLKRPNRSNRFLNRRNRILLQKSHLSPVFRFQLPILTRRALVELWWTKTESELSWFGELTKFRTGTKSRFYWLPLTLPIQSPSKISFLTPKSQNLIGKFINYEIIFMNKQFMIAERLQRFKKPKVDGVIVTPFLTFEHFLYRAGSP